jgi:hypothetical protein
MTSLMTRLEATAASTGKPPATAATAAATTTTPSPANAWARPLQAKTTTSPPPGMGPTKPTNAAGKTAPASSNTNGNGNNNTMPSMATIHRERLLHLSLTLVGQKVVVTQTNGAVLEGIFHTFTPFAGLSADMKNKYVLNAVKTVKPPTVVSEENATTTTIIKDGSTVILPVEKVVCLHAKNINLDRPAMTNGGSTSKTDVMTDTQISGSRGGRSRDLVAAGSAWTAGGKSRADALAGAIDDNNQGPTRKDFGTATTTRVAGLKGSIGEWDQFKANQELFNVNASYDENLYTTELDKSQLDSKKIAQAERLAREILNTSSTNIHIAEERGHAVETDFDEEDRYSGVLTKDGKQRHTATIKGPADKSTASEAKSAAPSLAAPKKMNYAAAAAKADAGKKAAPPGFAAKTPTTSSKADEAAKATPDEKRKESEEPVKPTEQSKADTPKQEKDSQGAADKKEEKKEPKKDDDGKQSSRDEEKAEEKDKKEEGKKTVKLNANAKSFTFNPGAKSFTPTFGGGSTNFSAPDAQHQQQPQRMADPNAAMQMHAGAHPMQSPHYMHAPMGQPGEF